MSMKKASVRTVYLVDEIHANTFLFIYVLQLRKAIHQPIIVAIFGKQVIRCSMFTIIFLYYMNFNNITFLIRKIYL